MRISGGISGVCSSDLSFSTTGIGLPSFAGGKAMLAAEIEPADAPGRRRSARAAVALDARIDRGGLGRALCRVVDLSVHGARLETYSALRRGATIWLTLTSTSELTIGRATCRESDCQHLLDSGGYE